VRAGMLIVVVSILGVLAPTVAQAETSFTAGQYPATVTGTSAKGNDTIVLEGGSVECKTSYHAKLQEPSTALTIAPTYSECRAFGFLSATVVATGCAYRVHVGEGASEDSFKSTFDISCEAGKAIKVTASACEAEIGSQAELTAMLSVNTAASPRDITFDPEASGIAYTVLKDGFGCPFSGTGSKTGGTFTAHSPITLAGQAPENSEYGIGLDIGDPSPTAFFTAGQYPATVTGTSAKGNDTIVLEGGSVECKTSYHAKLQEPSTALTIAPTYSECRAFGFLSATVVATGCAYRVHVGEGASEDSFKSTFDISCEAGKAIKVTASACEAEIGSQAELTAMLSVNTAASPRDITFDPEASGIAYTVLKDGFGCPFSGTGSKTGGTFTAHSPITLAAEGIAVDIG
jgi:hypothetical protein